MLVPQLDNPQHIWLILRLKRFDSFLNNLHRLQEIYIGVTFNLKGRLSKDKNYVNSDICFKMYKNTKYSDMVINIYNVQVTVYKDTQLLSNSLLKSGKTDKFDLYTITIGGLSESDYGNYSCVARNNLGTSFDSLSISGNTENGLEQQWNCYLAKYHK